MIPKKYEIIGEVYSPDYGLLNVDNFDGSIDLIQVLSELENKRVKVVIEVIE